MYCKLQIFGFDWYIIALQRTNKLNLIIMYMKFCLDSWTVEDKVYVWHLVRSIPSFNSCHFCPLSECALALQERPLWHWESHKGGETSHKTRQQSLLQPLSHLQPPTSSLNLYFFSKNVENFLLFIRQLITRHRKALGCILRCSMSD